MSGDPLAAAIAALWREVAPEQLAAAHELEAAATRVVAQPADAAAWERVRALAHRLAGTLGSFGQVEAGQLAERLEARVAGTTEPDAALREEAAQLARELRTALEAAA
ncbi:Hpt domain-containing protein [Egicoccus sp. AB-alg2]|uniref:Hpt domain-containing protein n=1 Tax=Egicoccus sp. AB-alg2 TaxID=3242693 RepID=UPI00359CE163